MFGPRRAYRADDSLKSMKRQPVAHDPSLRLYVVAFQGDEEALAQTLKDLADEREAIIEVLASDDASLRGPVDATGTAYHAVLPAVCENDRYWLTVLQALPAGGGRSWVAVVRAGTRLPSYYVRRMRTAAAKAGGSALFPLSTRHPASMVFNASNHRPSLPVGEVDRWLNHYAAGVDIDVPLFAGYNALFRDIPSLDGVENDLQLVSGWRDTGAVLIATDAIYVDDSRLPVLSLPDALYPAWRDALLVRHPHTGLRHALTELSDRRECAPAEIPPVRPVRLHVSHSWGGGLGRWVEDFVAADESHQSLVLRPIGEWDAFCQVLALYPSAKMDVPLKTWTLAQPILSTEIAHGQYRQILAEILATYSVSTIMVSSLIGHSLDVLKTGLPTTYVHHDFYPACPPLYAAWESPCTSCDKDRLKACLKSNPNHRIFRVEPDTHWQALREGFVSTVVERDIALVAPCHSVAQRLQSLLPGLSGKSIHIIEHGLSPDLIAALGTARNRYRDDGRLRIVILGSLAEHKGASLLLPVLEQITLFADLLLLGAGEDGRLFSRKSGVTVVDRYERARLGELLADWAPDLGILMSTVPETFSYTLSELHAAGIPVAATALGAFADRIQSGSNGWLFEPQPQELLKLLERLQGEREEIAKVRERLLSLTVRESSAMVADYEAVLARAGFAPVSRPVTGKASTVDYLAHGHLHIDHQAPYRQVLKDFLRYTAGKVQRTERLPGLVKKVVGFLLGRLM